MGLLKSVAKKAVMAVAVVVGKRIVTRLAGKLKSKPATSPQSATPPQK